MTQDLGASPLLQPRLAIFAAASALACGLLPGRGAAWAALAIGVGGGLVVLADLRLRPGQPLRWLLLLLTLCPALASIPELLPRSTSADALARAAESSEAQWRAFLAELESAVDAPPPPGEVEDEYEIDELFK